MQNVKRLENRLKSLAMADHDSKLEGEEGEEHESSDAELTEPNTQNLKPGPAWPIEVLAIVASHLNGTDLLNAICVCDQLKVGMMPLLFAISFGISTPARTSHATPSVWWKKERSLLMDIAWPKNSETTKTSAEQ
jgi:hypothetical protein